ncbi:uncharacterized protein LAESUDRAFT_765121 [Laetiporus sulphureus 93-53]|uniref:Uncharacterized protein n=1 Tax=Laetiporus sulphureus 93-53 TaxID=1314785 RepID=A0A165AY14_9APHY|nr:uncharacterized protein LAESUDRAFT_765121 [Laetiporus sulphureus 93-53]KZS99873.1 hypothetical protein LAESUDRAFT_765121 [Laetiporus sulphureus 93-53]
MRGIVRPRFADRPSLLALHDDQPLARACKPAAFFVRHTAYLASYAMSLSRRPAISAAYALVPSARPTSVQTHAGDSAASSVAPREGSLRMAPRRQDSSTTGERAHGRLAQLTAPHAPPVACLFSPYQAVSRPLASPSPPRSASAPPMLEDVACRSAFGSQTPPCPTRWEQVNVEAQRRYGLRAVAPQKR